MIGWERVTTMVGRGIPTMVGKGIPTIVGRYPPPCICPPYTSWVYPTLLHTPGTSRHGTAEYGPTAVGVKKPWAQEKRELTGITGNISKIWKSVTFGMPFWTQTFSSPQEKREKIGCHKGLTRAINTGEAIPREVQHSSLCFQEGPYTPFMLPGGHNPPCFRPVTA